MEKILNLLAFITVGGIGYALGMNTHVNPEHATVDEEFINEVARITNASYELINIMADKDSTFMDTTMECDVYFEWYQSYKYLYEKL